MFFFGSEYVNLKGLSFPKNAEEPTYPLLTRKQIIPILAPPGTHAQSSHLHSQTPAWCSAHLCIKVMNS